MITTASRIVTVPVLGLALATPMFAAGGSAALAIGIEDVAPDNTVMIVGVSDAAALRARVEEVFAELEAMQDEAFEKALEQVPEDIRNFVPFGDESAMPAPTGSIGLALYPGMDDELGLPFAAFMAMAEYDEATAPEAMVKLAQLITDAGVQAGYSFKTRELRGRTLYELTLPEDQPADEDIWAQGGEMDMMPDPADLLGDLTKVFILAGGRHILAGSDLPNLEDAARRLDGEMRPVLTDNRYFRGTMMQLGTPDTYAVVLTTDLLDITGGVDPMNMAQVFTPTAKAIFGDVKGIGWGSSFDQAEAMYSVYMPRGKQGLPALLTKPVDMGPPPSFVPAGMGFSSMSIDLAGLVPLIDRIIQTNPLLMQAGQPWNERRAEVGAALQGLGPRIILSAVGEEEPFMAIDAREPEAAEQMLAGMLGTTPRAMGNGKIFDLAAPGGNAAMPVPMPMPVDQAVGLAGGYAIMGPKGLVETALLGPAEMPVASHPDYVRARSTIEGADIVAWGYAPLPDAPGALSVWSLRSTEDGFIGHMKMLMAEAGAIGDGFANGAGGR